MHVPQWLKPGFWGIVIGALGIMIHGFTWGGWVLCSSAESMAKERANEAVTAILVPICVERFMGQADAAAKLTEFQKTASLQQTQLLEKGGWATMAGSKDPNAAVARMCAQQLVNRKA
jgi:membrane glycosyltransferase